MEKTYTVKPAERVIKLWMGKLSSYSVEGLQNMLSRVKKNPRKYAIGVREALERLLQDVSEISDEQRLADAVGREVKRLFKEKEGKA